LQANLWSAPAERSGDGALDFGIKLYEQIQSAVAVALSGALQILGAKRPERASSVAVPFD